MGRDGRTYRQYMVRPTAVPIRAALRAVDMMEPARPWWCLAGGAMSTCNNKTSRCLLAMNKKQEGRRGRRKENIVGLQK
jgi:hypothetical protein